MQKKAKRKTISMLLTLMMVFSLFASVVPAAYAEEAASQSDGYIISNPYDNVDWGAYGQYKASFHTHSTNSDGSNTTADMIEDHYAKGFHIVAMTDHNYTTPGWEFADKGWMSSARKAEIEAGTAVVDPFFDRGIDRHGLGMIDVSFSNEQSLTDHLNSFFVNYNQSAGATLAGTVAAVEARNGLTHLNHIGRYTGALTGSNAEGLTGPAASNAPSVIAKYVNLFRAYPSLLGMEIVNSTDNESRYDKILWDNILKQLMLEDRPVWGFANDDSHSLGSTGFTWNVMLMPELTATATRNAMIAGSFYTVSRIDRVEGINALNLTYTTPSITNIAVDEEIGTITVAGADYDLIEWIADGEKIATGNTINLNDYTYQISSYVRAQLKSATGIAYTQPFGVVSPFGRLSAKDMSAYGQLTFGVKKIATPPVLDGTVNQAKYGEPIAVFNQDAPGAYWSSGEALSDEALSAILPQDFTLYAAYDDDNLYLAATVFDPDHNTPLGGVQVWEGDYFGINISTRVSESFIDMRDPSRFALGMTNDGSICMYSARKPADITAPYTGGYQSGADYIFNGFGTVTRNDETKITTYEMKLPWQFITASGKPVPDAFITPYLGIGHSGYASTMGYGAYLGSFSCSAQVPAELQTAVGGASVYHLLDFIGVEPPVEIKKLDGDGTAGSPYLIGSKEELLFAVEKMNNFDQTYSYAKQYKLTADIDLGGENFPMISEFRGVLDGSGFTITGLVMTNNNIPASGTVTVGFIRNLNNGTVKDLAIKGARAALSGATTNTAVRVALLAADAVNGSRISGCMVTGTVDDGGCSYRAGGIVGQMSISSGTPGSIIEDCFFSGDVTGREAASGIASYGNSNGLGLTAQTIVRRCISMGNFITTVGGQGTSLVVDHPGGSSVDQSMVVENCVAYAGTVTSPNSQRGRIYGYTSYSSKIGYNLGGTEILLNGIKVSSTNPNGANGLDVSPASLQEQATYEALGWDFDKVWKMGFDGARNALYPIPIYANIDESTVVLTATETTINKSQTVTLTAAVIPNDTVVENVQWFVNGVVQAEQGLVYTLYASEAGTYAVYIVVNGLESRVVLITAEPEGVITKLEGSGTEIDPYQIGSKEELLFAVEKMNDGNAKYSPAMCYALIADIDLGGDSFPMINYFCGLLDGRGHAIDGLVMTENNVPASGTVRVAFIKTLSHGTVKNLAFRDSIATLAGATTNTSVQVATIAAYLDDGALISACMVTGLVDGGSSSYRAGGIAGQVATSSGMSGCIIEDCFFSGDVRGREAASGILSYGNSNGAVSSTTVRRCISMGNFTTTAGGQGTSLVVDHPGGNSAPESMTVEYNVAYAGSVTSPNAQRGRIYGYTSFSSKVGYNLGCTEILLNGLKASSTNPSGINGLDATPADLREQATYEALGWDFEYTWKMSGDGYPVLYFCDTEVIRPEPFEAEMLTLQPGTDATAMNFTWYSDRDTANNLSLVEIAKASDPDNVVTLVGTFGDATDGKSWHKTGVSGLDPDTGYIYRVSHDGENFSVDYTFKTGSAGAFTFAVVGDPQLTVGNQDATSNYRPDGLVGTTKQGWQDTLNAITGKGVDFIAGVGDQVDASLVTNEAEYANFFAPTQMSGLPFAPAVGNHDRHDGFAYHYNLPGEQAFATLTGPAYGNPTGPQSEAEARGNYYYLYNNALFVVLNTSSYPTSKEAAAAVVARFDATLSVATGAYAGQYDWLFVQHHKSTESVADHLADRDIQYYMEAGFEKLMDQYGVDFVLAGHDHVYARSYPLLDGVPDKRGASGEPNVTLTMGGDGADYAVNPKGTVYFTTTTGSGLKYYELFNNAGNLYVKDNEEYPYLVDGLVGSAEYMKGNLPYSTAKYLQNKTPGFILVNVDGKEVSFTYHDLSGEYLDIPYDTYTVVKTDEPVVTEKIINILHTNDSHGRIYQVDGNNADMIGIDKIASIKNNMENAILVDAGDTFHGLPIVNVNSGLNAIDLMTVAGYSVITPGNHDFNYGSGRLSALADLASMNGLYIISSNTFAKGTDQSFLPTTKIVEIDNLKVGFFGLTTTETPILTGPVNVETLEFRAYKQSAEAAIASLKASGAEIIVALAHVSRSEIETLVKALDVKPDVVIEGHDHNLGFVIIDGVLITGAGQYQENLGLVSLTINSNGVILDKTASYITKADTTGVVGAVNVREMAETMKASVLEQYSIVVASSEALLSSARGTDDGVTLGVRNAEQPLGNLVADAMRIVGAADIAVTNGGGLRADVKAGDLTKGDINAILPFGNVLVIKEATPKALKEIMEVGLQTAPVTHGRFPQISGLSVVYDQAKPVGQKVVSITIGGVVLDLADDTKTYKLATNDFMASGGDGYDVIKDLGTLAELASLDDALIEYITVYLGGVITAADARLEGRISIYEEAQRYIVAFVDHDDTVLKEETVEHGQAAIAPADPIREGYTFTGWDTDFSEITGDLTIRARYDLNPVLVVSATPSAYITKLSGNKNDLTITVTELLSNGTTNDVTKTFSISNNAADVYTLGGYLVYVDTKGNDQIRECAIRK